MEGKVETETISPLAGQLKRRARITSADANTRNRYGPFIPSPLHVSRCNGIRIFGEPGDRISFPVFRACRAILPGGVIQGNRALPAPCPHPRLQVPGSLCPKEPLRHEAPVAVRPVLLKAEHDDVAFRHEFPNLAEHLIRVEGSRK